MKQTYRLFTAAIFVFYTAFGMIAAELVRVTYHIHSWLLFGMVVFGWLALVTNWLLNEIKKEDIREEIRNGRR
jgi:predicted tellurium resistance membrane protein TerC